ncbi:unnamed protein product [Medioppia subpectinata]|uniref:Uncharacterized protein n=1 Tax=Medioppia subpectinata TaxID=1979941 RepID=A0A7R9KC53_9ACAR|nr:unnamed protein product [Medioppia subpectinata]CAG2100598.1 unnamed protein product [Medioppia subpectinata]
MAIRVGFPPVPSIARSIAPPVLPPKAIVFVVQHYCHAVKYRVVLVVFALICRADTLSNSPVYSYNRWTRAEQKKEIFSSLRIVFVIPFWSNESLLVYMNEHSEALQVNYSFGFISTKKLQKENEQCVQSLWSFTANHVFLAVFLLISSSNVSLNGSMEIVMQILMQLCCH